MMARPLDQGQYLPRDQVGSHPFLAPPSDPAQQRSRRVFGAYLALSRRAAHIFTRDVLPAVALRLPLHLGRHLATHPLRSSFDFDTTWPSYPNSQTLDARVSTSLGVSSRRKTTTSRMMPLKYARLPGGPSLPICRGVSDVTAESVL